VCEDMNADRVEYIALERGRHALLLHEDLVAYRVQLSVLRGVVHPFNAERRHGQ